MHLVTEQYGVFVYVCVGLFAFIDSISKIEGIMEVDKYECNTFFMWFIRNFVYFTCENENLSPQIPNVTSFHLCNQSDEHPWVNSASRPPTIDRNTDTRQVSCYTF